MKNIFLIVALLYSSTHVVAQNYKLDFKVEGLADTTVYLGNYFGESTYLKDTAQVNSNGEFTFDGNKELESGMYFLVLNKTRLFDFLVDKNKHFKITTSTEDYIYNLNVEGDISNKLFIDDMIFNAERNKEASPFVQVVQDSLSTEQEVKEAKAALDKINDKVLAHQDKIIKEHPDLLISKIFLANRRADIPDTPEDEDPTEFGYQYLKKNYWNNFNLGDPAMLRLGRPIYKEKVENYFNRLIIPQPDSIIKQVNLLAKEAKVTQDTYKYFIWTVTLLYQNPTIMGLDRVFVEMIDTYFESGEMDFWANSQLKKNLKERADQLRLSLIGNKAANMVMMDKDKQMKSLYAIPNKYTVIYFFDPDCGHCKKETPVLADFYSSTKYDVEVFAVSADTSIVKMENYINKMGMKWITVNGPRTATGSYHDSYDANTTPTIYVLDEKKKIIAKKIPAARLEDFLTQYEKFHVESENEQ
ncbi:MAG: thioredoxin-like domain-containing protein [Fulvivirga sp.]|uniref:thioredoxin-like domain-containing protein n=1 Tax=Fulvivirga sp. TaxID=1931237 RepID=UPI0032EEF1BB